MHEVACAMAALEFVRGVLFDLDGVVWRGREPVPGAAESIALIKRAGIPVRFVSNNSSLDRAGVQQRLLKFGVPAEVEEVFVVTHLLAREIARRENRATVYLIGAAGMRKELEAHGLRVIDEPEEIDYLTDFVVAGSDPDLSMLKLTRALRCLQKGAKFAAPNLDVTYPVEDGHVPGSGAIAAAVSAMAGRPPDIMIAKPKPDLLLKAAESMGLPPAQCLMVGDSLQSDVPAAKAAGMPSLLVLTGGAAASDIEKAEARPDYVAESVADLPGLLGLKPREA